MVDPQRPPNPLLCQVSGTDAEGRFILALMARRTYDIDKRGRCSLAAEQTPLAIEIAAHAHDDQLVGHCARPH